MSCGTPHLDIFEDTTEESRVGDSLELDRIKDKIRSIWNQLLVAQYNETYKYQSDEDDDYVALAEYTDKNKLQFAGEEQATTEVDSILEMLEGLLENGDELSPVDSEGKAPSYGSTSLSSNKDSSTVAATTYKVKHSATKPVSDSKSRVKSGTYDKPTSGKIALRKDSQVKRNFSPMIKKIVEELLDLDSRKSMGRREMLFRL